MSASMTTIALQAPFLVNKFYKYKKNNYAKSIKQVVV